MTQNDPQTTSKQLSEDAIRDRLESLTAGAEVVFNDRKIPLEVEFIDDQGRIHIRGPEGGEYELWPEALWVQNSSSGPPFNPANLNWVKMIGN